MLIAFTFASAQLASRAESETAPVTAAGEVVEQWYCDEPQGDGSGTLYLRFLLHLRNTGDSPLILTRLFGHAIAWQVARTLEDAEASRFELSVTDTLDIVGSVAGEEPDPGSLPPRVKRGDSPDSEQFFVILPGGTATAQILESVPVARRSRELTPGLEFGKNYVIRLRVDVWPFWESEATARAEIQPLWSGVGVLALGAVETDFIPFSTPGKHSFPACPAEESSPRE